MAIIDLEEDCFRFFINFMGFCLMLIVIKNGAINIVNQLQYLIWFFINASFSFIFRRVKKSDF